MAMGSFNILKANIKCRNCRLEFEARIQFKYGDTWQLEYQVGDTIAWGGNDIGSPGKRKVMVHGILETEKCSVCGKECADEEFDIILESDKIVGLRNMLDRQIYIENDEGYYFLPE